MSRQSRSYLRYGSFVLLSKLEESSLGDIWRAAPIEGNSIAPPVTLFRFTGGDQSALRRAAEQAARTLRTIDGSTVVKGQTYHLVGRNPIVTWDYVGGRSLYHMLEVGKGGPELPPNPFPIDQSLAIAEKLALSLETTGHIKHGGQRLHHGVLIPQMVWVSEDGDVRTLGHQLTKGMLASIGRPPVQKEFGGFVAPELRRNGEATAPSEVWAIGANLYAMLTGELPPAPTDQPAIDALLSDAILATEETIPDHVREILTRALAIDPARRYESPAALREALGSLIHGGEYAPTTFNLAFYIHNLLREEIEAEAAERETEKGIDPSLVPPMAGIAESEPAAESGPAATVPPATPVTGPGEPAARKGRSKIPLIAAIVILALGLGAAGYWFTIGPGGADPSEKIADAGRSALNDAAAPPRPSPRVEPLVAVTDTGEGGLPIETTTAEQTGPSEEELRQKLIQEEIDRRLEAEILKLQSEYDRRLRDERDKNRARSDSPPAPQQTPARPTTPVRMTTASPSAEELDRRQLEESTDTAPAPSVTQPAATTTTAPVESRPAPPTETAKSAAPVTPPVREGDLIEFTEVDKPPSLIRRANPEYPRLAARQKAEATVVLTALVSENGKVIDVKILRGDKRKLGFDEAAIEAIRKSTFEPATKDGKKVKTWMPVPIFFKAE